MNKVEQHILRSIYDREWDTCILKQLSNKKEAVIKCVEDLFSRNYITSKDNERLKEDVLFDMISLLKKVNRTPEEINSAKFYVYLIDLALDDLMKGLAEADNVNTELTDKLLEHKKQQVKALEDIINPDIDFDMLDKTWGYFIEDYRKIIANSKNLEEEKKKLEKSRDKYTLDVLDKNGNIDKKSAEQFRLTERGLTMIDRMDNQKIVNIYTSITVVLSFLSIVILIVSICVNIWSTVFMAYH